MLDRTLNQAMASARPSLLLFARKFTRYRNDR